MASEGDNIFDKLPAKTPWYHRTGGRIFLVMILFAVLGATIFGILVFSYAKKIKGGEMIGGFSRNPDASGRATVSGIVPELLVRPQDPAIGPVDARLTIVEFGDFECPFCRQAFPDIRAFQAAHPTEVRFVWRQYPLTSIHANALLFAEASLCAHEQGKFWAYHDKLFSEQGSATEDDVIQLARATGADVLLFQNCLASGKMREQVAGDIQTAMDLGVIGTPTFFVNGERIPGVIPKKLWELMLAEVIKREKDTERVDR